MSEACIPPVDVEKNASVLKKFNILSGSFGKGCLMKKLNNLVGLWPHILETQAKRNVFYRLLNQVKLIPPLYIIIGFTFA